MRKADVEEKNKIGRHDEETEGEGEEEKITKGKGKRSELEEMRSDSR